MEWATNCVTAVQFVQDVQINCVKLFNIWLQVTCNQAVYRYLFIYLFVLWVISSGHASVSDKLCKWALYIIHNWPTLKCLVLIYKYIAIVHLNTVNTPSPPRFPRSLQYAAFSQSRTISFNKLLFISGQFQFTEEVNYYFWPISSISQKHQMKCSTLWHRHR